MSKNKILTIVVGGVVVSLIDFYFLGFKDMTLQLFLHNVLIMTYATSFATRK